MSALENAIFLKKIEAVQNRKAEEIAMLLRPAVAPLPDASPSFMAFIK